MAPELEQVFVVPRLELEKAGLLRDGFTPAESESMVALVDRLIARHGFFLPRPEAEEEPRWKQIIPYGVVSCSGQVFMIQRSKKGGEPRLHNRYSIGIGGHINPAASGPGAPPRPDLEKELRRELEEELEWKVAYEARFLGALNDDSNPVGQVHFGLVYLVLAATPKVLSGQSRSGVFEAGDWPKNLVQVRETELLSGGFASLETLARRLPDLETWSQLIAGFILKGGLASGLPAQPGGNARRYGSFERQ